MEKFIPSYTHNTHTHTHKKSFIIMGRNSSTNSCSVFFIFLFTLCVSFWNDSTIKTNLNWSGWKFSFLLTAFHSLPHTTILPFKFLWILSKNLRHQAQFLSERNSQVDIRREREWMRSELRAFIELTTIASFVGEKSKGIASNKYLAQFCGNVPFKIHSQQKQQQQ